jgi:vacuolar-type H+-ATPase subunit H
LSRKDRPAPPQPLVTDTAERLAAIVEAAERAAVTVIDDAEKQAKRRLEQAESEAQELLAARLSALSELTDSLAAQAEAIRNQSEQLLAALGEAKRRIAAAGGDEPSGPDRPGRVAHLSAVDSVDGVPAAPAEVPRIDPGAAAGQGAPASPGGAAGARLLATQMAVSGSSREEIEARLRNGFEIEDTASILDAILGPEE